MTNVKVLECKHCGKAYVPPVYHCDACRHEEAQFIDREVPGKGKVFSFSTIWVAPKLLEDIAPYTLAIVELDGGVKIIGRFAAEGGADVAVGTPVEVLIGDQGEFLLKLAS